MIQIYTLCRFLHGLWHNYCYDHICEHSHMQQQRSNTTETFEKMSCFTQQPKANSA